MQSVNSTFINKLRFNESGLIPAIAQDWLDGTVLMMAWMNRSAIEHTIKKGEVHYWSRSRNVLWHKGATSGHTQILKEIRYDCDADTILLTVEQTGLVSCHTGARSCFFGESDKDTQGGEHALPPPSDSCNTLFQTIEGRKANPEKNSYTNKLLNAGDNQILKKIGEESAEFVMACKDEDKESIANEAADLLFHIQVALSHHNVSWRDVLGVLTSRRNGPRR